MHRSNTEEAVADYTAKAKPNLLEKLPVNSCPVAAEKQKRSFAAAADEFVDAEAEEVGRLGKLSMRVDLDIE